MEAWVWPSDWGLISIDCKCLQLVTYAKFSGAPLTIHESGNPFWTPKSTLPVFRQNELEFATFGAVVNHLRIMKYSADYNLSSKQQAEVVAFGQLMEEKLYPALLHVFWLDTNNHSTMTRPWYFSKMHFPMKFYYPVISIRLNRISHCKIPQKINIPFWKSTLALINLLKNTSVLDESGRTNEICHRFEQKTTKF